MDPQEKWLSARRRRWMRGRELGMGHWSLKEHPSFSSMGGGPPWREADWLWPQCGSISSLLLISKAHYFVLRLASGQSSFRALSWPTVVSFLPLHPTPHWPFTQTIIYFGEFLGYCFVRANQGWVTNDPGGVEVAWPQPTPFPASQVTHVAKFTFESFTSIAFVLDSETEAGMKKNWRRRGGLMRVPAESGWVWLNNNSLNQTWRYISNCPIELKGPGWVHSKNQKILTT